MISVTAWVRMTSAMSVSLPTSPTIRGTDFGSAERKPVDRSSTHDYGFAGVGEFVDHVAADIAAAAGDQDAHAVGSHELDMCVKAMAECV